MIDDSVRAATNPDYISRNFFSPRFQTDHHHNGHRRRNQEEDSEGHYPVREPPSGDSGAMLRSCLHCSHFVPAWFAVNMGASRLRHSIRSRICVRRAAHRRVTDRMSWLAGTGAISILFYSFPYGNGSEEMKILSLLFFFLNLGLFIVFTAVTAARYVLFPDLWSIMLQHPVQSLYLGCAPMGVATMISVAASLIHEGYGFGGKPFIYFVWAVWWLDVAVSALCCWQLMHIM